MLAGDLIDVFVGSLGALALIAVAMVPFLAVLRRGQRDLGRRIGEPNGRGDLTQIVTHNAEQHGVVKNQLQSIDTEMRKLASIQEHHSLLDTLRFKALHRHLGIPYDYPEEEAPDA